MCAYSDMPDRDMREVRVGHGQAVPANHETAGEGAAWQILGRKLFVRDLATTLFRLYFRCTLVHLFARSKLHVNNSKHGRLGSSVIAKLAVRIPVGTPWKSLVAMSYVYGC